MSNLSTQVLQISRRPCNQTGPTENSQQELEEEKKEKEVEKEKEKEKEVVMEERDGKEANLEETEEKKAKPDEREGREPESDPGKKDDDGAGVAETSETPEVGVEGRAGKDSDLELIEAEESREVVSGQSRGDSAEDRLFIDVGSLFKKPPPPPRIPVGSRPHSSGPG